MWILQEAELRKVLVCHNWVCHKRGFHMRVFRMMECHSLEFHNFLKEYHMKAYRMMGFHRMEYHSQVVAVHKLVIHIRRVLDNNRCLALGNNNLSPGLDTRIQATDHFLPVSGRCTLDSMVLGRGS